MSGGAVIERERRVFDDFFKIDEFLVAHVRIDGAMSASQRRLVFERGDSVAVLLLNADTRSVVLVEQFRMPTLAGRRRDNPSTTDGWITETVAGGVDANETPAAAAMREVFEETGFRVRQLRPIGRFFSSPGGTSERVFLYFAEVTDADRIATGGGDDDEDIKVVPLPIDELFDRVAAGSIEDPKLLIAAYWLQNRLKSRSPRAADSAATA
ncbi:MAG TPA: NUDIX hydrolase [Xanthobacteraceae bacterium]|nr:NUDIX hydrolase [Xanthobacteraceae bacterium]